MRTATVILLALAMASCVADPAPNASPSAGDGMVDATGAWVLESGQSDGMAIPIVADQPITMSVAGTQVSGTSACNGYGTKVAVVDGRLTLDEWSSTAMLCEDPVMASEAAFLEAMGRVTAARRDDDALVLFGDAVELRFVPLADVPMVDIVDRPWALVSIVEGDAERPPGGEPATVEFRSDGSFAGSTGCRSFTGRWIIAVAEVVATELAMDGRECPPDLAAQDGHVIQILEGFTADVDGATLRLTSRGEIGLVYEAGGPGASAAPS
jgi:heat shock protein HslJ